MSCGFANTIKNNNVYNTFSTQYRTVWLYTAYLGRVKVKVGSTNDTNTVYMECKGVGKNKDIIIREVDATNSIIDINTRPTLKRMSFTPPAKIDIKKNKETFYLIQKCELLRCMQNKDVTGLSLRQKTLNKFALSEPLLNREFTIKYANFKYTDKILRELYVYNSVVDIHFNTISYVEFLQEKLNRPSINNSTLLLSIFNVKDTDNAFFSGEYMLYGNGKTYFYPLTSIDVAGHELAHGLIQDTAGLEYQSESGALNESFADVFGTSFEHYLYKRFNEDNNLNNDIHGEKDWLMGEDIGKQIKYLRNIKDPNKAPMPQPKEYKGRYWKDTSDVSAQNDYGGVHVNSGVGNYCFYLMSQEVGIDVATSIFYNCLLKLNRKSDYKEYSDMLLTCTTDKKNMLKCIKAAKLPYSNTELNDNKTSNKFFKGVMNFVCEMEPCDESEFKSVKKRRIQ